MATSRIQNADDAVVVLRSFIVGLGSREMFDAFEMVLAERDKLFTNGIEALAQVARLQEAARADARALWAVRVFDALGRRLVKVNGPYTGGVSPCLIQLGGGFSAHWLGCGNQPVRESEDAARIAAAEARVAEDPTLGEGL